MNRSQIRFTGAGGQGAITAGGILVVAAIKDGCHAVGTPTYTSQVRGGPTLYEIILGSDEIYFPNTIPGEVDLMISTADVSYQRFKGAVRPGAIIVYDPNLVHPTEDDRRLWKFMPIPIVEIAKKEVGKIETQSAVVLAIAVSLTKCVSVESAVAAILEGVPLKYSELNKQAFALGTKYAEEGARVLSLVPTEVKKRTKQT